MDMLRHDLPALTGPLPPHQVNDLLAHASMLLRAQASAGPQAMLRGKTIGLLSASDAGDAALLCSAATQLGANVAHLRPTLAVKGGTADLPHTARMLGRLYNAVACQGVAQELVQELAREAGVPVYSDMASAGHAVVELAEQLDGSASIESRRCAMLQAALLATIT